MRTHHFTVTSFPSALHRRTTRSLQVKFGRMHDWRYLLSLGFSLITGLVIGIETGPGGLFHNQGSTQLENLGVAWGLGGFCVSIIASQIAGTDLHIPANKRWRQYKSWFYASVEMLIYTTGFLLML